MGKEINAGKQNLLLFTPATFSKKEKEKYLFTYHLILLTVNSVNLQILLSFSPSRSNRVKQLFEVCDTCNSLRQTILTFNDHLKTDFGKHCGKKRKC